MGPAPPLVLNHTYVFDARNNTRPGGTWWWDLYIADVTTGSGFVGPGGGHGTFSNSCCTSSIAWGAEEVDALTSQLPPTNGDRLLYRGLDGIWRGWGPSSLYPPSGGGPCRADDATNDPRFGCGGQIEFNSYWTTKYDNATIF